jgi:predicted Zn-dependent protease
LTEFEKAIQIDAKHAQAWYEKARLLDEKTQRPRKEQAYLAAISANNRVHRCAQRTCGLYLKNEQYPNAIAQYRSILKYEPDNREVAIKLAQVHLEVDEAKPAVADLETYVKNHNKDAQANFLFGQALYLSERETEAKNILKQLLLKTQIMRSAIAVGFDLT